jgi:hypothetical protein
MKMIKIDIKLFTLKYLVRIQKTVVDSKLNELNEKSEHLTLLPGIARQSVMFQS